MDKVTNPTEWELIKFQEDLLRKVLHDLREHVSTNRSDFSLIKKHIDEIREDIKVGKTEDLPSLFYQLEQQFKFYDKFSTSSDLPDFNSPYFAFMNIRQTKKEKIIFLGHQAFIPTDGSYRIVDWTNAPIAQVYYNYKAGEDFEIDLPSKTIEGILLEKNIITIRRGELVRIDKDNFTFIKKDGTWYRMNVESVMMGGGEGQAFRNISLGTGLTEYDSPEVVSLLDAFQFRLLNLSEDVSILLTGGAGSGKTTVALHRICKLCFNKNIPPKDVLVLVPHQGLVLLSKKILSSLGLAQIEVSTCRDWFVKQGGRLLKNIGRKVCQDTPFRVSMLKRHRNMSKVIDAYIELKRLEIVKRMEQAAFSDSFIQIFKSCSFLLQTLNEFLQGNLSIVQKMLLEQLLEELGDYDSIREELFKNRTLLENIRDENSDLITNKVIMEVISHTNKQFLKEVFDEEETDRTLDQKKFSFHAPEEVSGTIDVEDFPLLLLLNYKLGGMINNNLKLEYKHIVLDEAQEISPMEMIFIGKIVDKKGGSFTVAGDMAQKVDQTCGFTGWNDALLDLEIATDLTEIKTLEIAYRSPQKIIDLAHSVLGPLASGKTPLSKKNHGGVIQTLGEHEAHILIMINGMLEKLMDLEPKSSTAIICTCLETAKRYREGLKNLKNIRLVEDSHFTFRPGVDITTVEQVKGLEFDYVIIPDLDFKNYPVSDYSRRRLHLAMTRAIYQLWILSPGTFSPLIPLSIF